MSEREGNGFTSPRIGTKGRLLCGRQKPSCSVKYEEFLKNLGSNLFVKDCVRSTEFQDITAYMIERPIG